jgi:hypothetical protein
VLAFQLSSRFALLDFVAVKAANYPGHFSSWAGRPGAKGNGCMTLRCAAFN